MNSDVVVAVIAFLGTCFGTVGGIMASAKLTNYRLTQLEKEFGKHSDIIEKIPVMEEQIKDIKKRLDSIEKA